MLATQPVDFRKSVHTLSALVSEALRADFEPSVDRRAQGGVQHARTARRRFDFTRCSPHTSPIQPTPQVRFPPDVLKASYVTPYPPRPRHILRQVEVMRAGRAGRFRNAGCQIERAGIEHGELPIEQIDQLRTVLDIRDSGA
jgi:hypothetical protein